MVYNQAPLCRRCLKGRLSGLIEEAQMHTTVEASHYTGNTCSDKEDAQKAEGGLSGPSQGRPSRLLSNKGKKCI